MSHEPPRGRETPLWSTGGQDPSAEASMAGLPGSRALVAVGPPLAAKLPNLGSMGCASVPMVSPSLGMNPQSLSMPIRLRPSELTIPKQSGPSSAVLPAKIVLDIETPSLCTINFTTNPPPSRAALPLTVLLVNVNTPRLSIPAE